METIIALDPGTTTGVCYGLKYDNDERLYIAPWEERYSLYDLHELLIQFLDNAVGHANIIYEDFQYRNYARAGLDLTPVKMIGVIELIAEMYEPNILTTKQSPATGKSFYNDVELKRIGCYKVGMQHGRDATRHLLQWVNFGAGGQFFQHDVLTYEMFDTPSELFARV